jgi:hypothetical protein
MAQAPLALGLRWDVCIIAKPSSQQGEMPIACVSAICLSVTEDDS